MVSYYHKNTCEICTIVMPIDVAARKVAQKYVAVSQSNARNIANVKIVVICKDIVTFLGKALINIVIKHLTFPRKN